MTSLTDTDTVKTMRLGKNSPAERNLRRLLVILREANHVRKLLASARQLQLSTNPAAQNGVYINQSHERGSRGRLPTSCETTPGG